MKWYTIHVQTVDSSDTGPILQFRVLARDLEEAKKKSNWALKITIFE